VSQHTPAQPVRPLITIDLSAWPQVQTHLPLGTPLPLIIQALELTLAQLRELLIQARSSVRG